MLDVGWLRYGCRHYGWTQVWCVRRGRPGLTGETRRTFRRGYPAADSLSRIFVRIGCRLDGLPYTIPDSMPGSLDCAAGDCNPLVIPSTSSARSSDAAG